MTWKPARSAKGYGKADKELNRALRAARTRGEADQIARADGHKNADAAKAWLEERS